MIRVRGHDHKSYTLYHIKFYCSKATLHRRSKSPFLSKHHSDPTDKENSHADHLLFSENFYFYLLL